MESSGASHYETTASRDAGKNRERIRSIWKECRFIKLSISSHASRFRVFSPAGQDTSEWESRSSNTKPTLGYAESVFSLITAMHNSSIPNPTSHPNSLSCLPFPQKQHQTKSPTRNNPQTPNSHTNRS